MHIPKAHFSYFCCWVKIESLCAADAMVACNGGQQRSEAKVDCDSRRGERECQCNNVRRRCYGTRQPHAPSLPARGDAHLLLDSYHQLQHRIFNLHNIYYKWYILIRFPAFLSDSTRKTGRGLEASPSLFYLHGWFRLVSTSRARKRRKENKVSVAYIECVYRYAVQCYSSTVLC